jgi:hypothetical protein
MNHAHNNDEIENFLDLPCQMTLPIKTFLPWAVRQASNKGNQHKAPGYDLIMGKLPRQLPKKKAVILLTTIYNSMLRLSYFQRYGNLLKSQ